ncbi:MAG TPA: 3-keto-5-aminohexanoate cleavage protein [Lacipirellulaceae bacterium]|mgnify:CR=1 FL=1|nr:3-keto-5-aminohexanoate cleavage protein [Lacipirellulaceae bacterium]
MDKLIVTVTCDSTMAYPSNPYNPTPKGYDEVAREYCRALDAGASICHLHGPYTIDEEFQPDGTKLSDLDIPGWVKLADDITNHADAIIQYGIANGRFPQRVELVKARKPDMISTCFNAHDECFDYEPNCVPVELYGLHDRVELGAYCRLARELDFTIECECFHYGGVWNAQRFVQQDLLATPVWITFFLGWRGGCYTPPTLQAMQYMHDHLPEDFQYNTSCMDPEEQWRVLTMAILLGGHVRVGMEDNPFVSSGEYARSNAQLVEKIVRISRELGRDVATPAEARRIIWPHKY